MVLFTRLLASLCPCLTILVLKKFLPRTGSFCVKTSQLPLGLNWNSTSDCNIFAVVVGCQYPFFRTVCKVDVFVSMRGNSSECRSNSVKRCPRSSCNHLYQCVLGVNCDTVCYSNPGFLFLEKNLPAAKAKKYSGTKLWSKTKLRRYVRLAS